MAHSIKQQELINLQNKNRLEQEQLLGYWAKSKGITRADLEQHPHIDDVILLIKWREVMWLKLNPAERAVWGAYWGYTYNQRKQLKKKSLAKLEQITITATDRHLRNLVKKSQQRQLIKARRQNPYAKSSENIAAKAEDAAQSAPWD